MADIVSISITSLNLLELVRSYFGVYPDKINFVNVDLGIILAITAVLLSQIWE